MTDPAVGEDVPFEDSNSDSRLYEALVRSVSWVGDGNNRTLFWKCPRCTHRQSDEVELEGRIIALTFGKGPNEPRRGHVDVVCDCKQPHTGRPSDVAHQGCGYGARLVVEI
jgi:hypothetical protein